MNSYVFAVSDQPVLAASASLIAMEKMCDEYFQIVLEDDDELKVLMDLLGVWDPSEKPLLMNEDFSAVFDFSATPLPQLSKEDFDKFYDDWLRKSGRETSMDEYGQLIFLQGRGDSWNRKTSRFVLRERL